MKMMEPQSIKKFEHQQTPPMAEVIWLQNLKKQELCTSLVKICLFSTSKYGYTFKIEHT